MTLPVAVAAFVAVVLVYAQDRGAISRFLAGRLPVLLGTLSYSIYMIHGTFLNGAGAGFERLEPLLGAGLVSRFEGPIQGDLLAFALLAAVCCLAYLSYRFIESPAREWSRGVARRMARDPAVSPARAKIG